MQTHHELKTVAAGLFAPSASVSVSCNSFSVFYFYFIEVEGIYLFISGVPDQSPDLLYSYLEEAAMGRNFQLHVVLFNVDDYDVNGAIPSRYANITKTAEILRNMAHCN